MRIASMSAFVNGPENMTKSQRKAVNQVAANASTEWFD